MAHETLERDERVRGSSDRTFGLVFAVVLVLVALAPLVHGGAPRYWSLAAAAALAGCAIAFPAVLAPLNRLWLQLGLALHRVVNPVVLGVMFYLVVTPTGLVLRALGKDPLRLRRDPRAESYWIPRTPPGPAPESLRDQF